MVIAVIVLGIIAFVAILVALVIATPPFSLEEQEECIRQNQEEKELKKRQREARRQRRREAWRR